MEYDAFYYDCEDDRADATEEQIALAETIYDELGYDSFVAVEKYHFAEHAVEEFIGAYGLEDNVANYLDEERIANDAAHDYMSVEHNDVEYYVREA